MEDRDEVRSGREVIPSLRRVRGGGRERAGTRTTFGEVELDSFLRWWEEGLIKEVGVVESQEGRVRGPS